MHTNLLKYVSDKSGSWYSIADRFAPQKFELTNPDDEVELTGPVQVNVSVEGLLTLAPIAAGAPTTVSQPIYTYDVTIPAGRKLRYRMSDTVVPGLAQCRVVIRPTVLSGAAAAQAPFDLPCDFAVGAIQDTSAFFPAGCESCPPGSTVVPPPVCGPTLAVPTARGGCIRPRFFNGMFITREDLETQLRYVRMKHRLHNRAAGDGVVWGLGVARQGSRIVVAPGYAVDCCGNDLTVTCDYGVDVATLLSDPAVCRQIGPDPRRFHLLLEYVECAEEPRPIHGDTCSSQQTGCELSRVRETVRLRLVPPRDPPVDGPIQAFLDEVKQLRESNLLRELRNHALILRRNVFAPPRAEVPFDVEVQVASNTPTLLLSPPTDPLPADEGDLAYVIVNPLIDNPRILMMRADARAESRIPPIRVTVRARAGFSFTDGVPVLTRFDDADQSPAKPIEKVERTATEMTWTLTPDALTTQNTGGADPFPAQYVFTLDGWRLSRGAGFEFKGRTAIELTVVNSEKWSQTVWGRSHPAPDRAFVILHARVPPSDVEVIAPPTLDPWPCLEEACAADGTPLFPVPPPWLHEDPTREGRAGDPKVLMLSVLYMWLVGEMDRHRQGTPDAVVTGRLQLALWVYLAAWRLFFGVSNDDDRRDGTEALQALLRAWCRSFLYPGPQCVGEPHGVVIGCVEVKAGDICEVDPWGGRRWVVHYPLLAHWGAQVGLVPLDVTASRLISLICCFGELPLPALKLPERLGAFFERQPDSGIAILTNRRASTNAPVMEAGSGRFVFGTDNDIELLGVDVARVEALGLLAFVRRVLAALGETAALPGATWVDYRLAAFPDVHFLAPAPPAEPTTAPPAPPPAPPPSRLGELVRSTLAERAAKVTIPPLLRDTTEALSMRLLGNVPAPLAADSPIRTPLLLGGFSSVAALLTPPPEQLHAEVLNNANGRALSDALAESEKRARTVTAAIADVVVTMSDRKRLASVGDLQSEDVRAELVKNLSKSTRVPAKDVALTLDAMLKSS